MTSSIKSIFKSAITILQTFNGTSAKRLFLYAAIIYPLVIIYVYQNEIKIVLTSMQPRLSTISDLAMAQDRCYNLRIQEHATSVNVYLYQPASKNKSYKEQLIFSADDTYTHNTSLQTLSLSSSSRILEELRVSNMTIITGTSGHKESSIVVSQQLSKILIFPIRDVVSGQIIGEVWWYYRVDRNQNYEKLKQESQYFAYNVIS